MRKRLLALLSLTLLGLTACGGSGDSGSAVEDPAEETTSARLSAFANDTELELYLKSGLRENATQQSYAYAVELDMGVAQDLASDQPSSVQNRSYSTTNLQEQGVDEADRVKSDGNYLYLAPVAQQPAFFASVTSTTMAVDQSFASSLVSDAIRVMVLEEDPALAREVATIPLGDFQNQVQGLYLVHERENNAPDLLVTIGSTPKDVWGMWTCTWCWQETNTEVGIFDVSMPEDPLAAGTLSLDGQLVASRRIDEFLYLVTRYTPFIQDYIPYPTNIVEQEHNETILAEATLDELLPGIRFGSSASAPLVTAEQTYLPPTHQERVKDPTLITVTAIDLRDPTKYFSQTIAGPAETVYVSSESLIVATTHHPYDRLAITWDQASPEAHEVPPETTEIHKFQLTTEGPAYAGSGTVIGNLGWEPDKRPFRFGEDQGVLRVATSLGETWNDTSTTRLSLLREDADGFLEETAHLDNIGETGERLYAVRYLGKRAYLVTFRVTDPLYVFDLTDPFAPYKAGELHIQGYSDYLHPISESRLLGIGKDAIADDSATDLGGRGAWYQGVKLTLFDIANPATPREVSSLTIGKRGTESDALRNHHAVTYLPATTNRPARLALPLRLHDTPSSYPGFEPENPWTFYDWTHTGLYLFEITEEGIAPAGRLVVEDQNSADVSTFNSYGQDRSVLVNDNLHFVHGNEVWSSHWDDPQSPSVTP